MEKLEGRIECKVSKTEAKSADKWRICERCSSGWEDIKIEHIRNAIDAQRGVMLEIIEKLGVLLRFSVPTRHVKREHVIYLSLESDSVFKLIQNLHIS